MVTPYVWATTYGTRYGTWYELRNWPHKYTSGSPTSASDAAQAAEQLAKRVASEWSGGERVLSRRDAMAVPVTRAPPAAERRCSHRPPATNGKPSSKLRCTATQCPSSGGCRVGVDVDVGSGTDRLTCRGVVAAGHVGRRLWHGRCRRNHSAHPLGPLDG